MLPKPPPRMGSLGFLYIPPYRIQGVSVAGEQTVVQIPELDVAFDIGLCPKPALTANYVALSHGHMDHVAGLPYYFSQRMFQKMGEGNCVCHEAIAPALRRMMEGWVDVEQQRTRHNIIPIKPDGEIEIKNNIMLRAIEVSHTVPALGYSVIERRSKLREEYHGLPQSRLRELRQEGKEITKTLEIPLVAYTGDTEFGPYLFRDEFAQAKIVIAECTFCDEEHQGRARVGKHLHVRDFEALLQSWTAETIVLVHLSRRTHLGQVRQQLVDQLGREQASRIALLMDHQQNRIRYQQQADEAQACAVT